MRYPEQDPVFKLAGVAPDYAARLDFSNQLSGSYA